MIEFVTLFLGLVLGRIEVELVAEGAVAEVVLELDGAEAGRASAPPWKIAIDLGSGLRPRRLTARALDARGIELDRAVQYLNLHRPPAEVRLLTHRNGAGWVTGVGLAWQSRAGAEVVRWAVALDGRELAAEDPKKISLPPLDPREFHVVETEIEFSDGVVARDSVGTGGRFLDEASTQLTAKLITVAGPAETPAAESTKAIRVATGERPRVMAVERGDAEIVFVRDHWAREGITRLMTTGSGPGRLPGARAALVARVVEAVPLAPDERIRVLYPRALERVGPRLGYRLFAVTPAADRSDGFGLYWHLTTREPEAAHKLKSRLADALAIAGSQAASENRRRAVVLVLDPGSRDQESWLDAAHVHEYLQALDVPLHVWYLGKAARAPAEWGPVAAVRTVADMERALDAVRASLERQRIVWVEGLFLPAEISVELVGGGAGSAAGSGGAKPPPL